MTIDVDNVQTLYEEKESTDNIQQTLNSRSK